MSSTIVDITGLDKAAILAALYNHSRPMGMGFLKHQPGDMTVDEAREAIRLGDDHTRSFGGRVTKAMYFDYLNGRPLKSDLSGDTFETGLYNRDNGEGAAEAIIAKLRG